MEELQPLLRVLEATKEGMGGTTDRAKRAHRSRLGFGQAKVAWVRVLLASASFCG